MGGRREEIGRFVEEAVSESCSEEDADEAVGEQRVEECVFDFLVAVEPFYDEIGSDDAYEPAQPVPSEGDGSELCCDFAGVPEDVEHGFDV